MSAKAKIENKNKAVGVDKKAKAVNSSPSLGIIYSAVGVAYIKEMIKSAKSVKKYCPNIKITAFVDNRSIIKQMGVRKLFDRVKSIDLSEMKKHGYTQTTFGRYAKVIAMSSFPYQINLYLDVDTRIKGKIDNLLEKLEDQHDLAIANSPKLDKSTVPYRLKSYQKKGGYNSGVIVYRKNQRMKKVFELWIKNCQRKLDRKKLDDQGELEKIINQKLTPIKVRIISNKKYNARHTMIPKLKEDGFYHKVAIVHQSI